MAADETGKEVEAKKEGKSGTSLLPLILAMVMTIVVVLAFGGGALFWLAKSGRLAVGGIAPKVEAASKAEPVKTRLVTLDPLLVNLADPSGTGYLRIAIVLRAEDPPPAKDAKAKEEKAPEKGKPVVSENDVMLRDASLDVLGRETSAALLATGGKDHLKEDLRASFKARLPELKVVDVMFTDFLVQR